MKMIAMKDLMVFIAGLMKGSSFSPNTSLRVGRAKAMMWYLQSIKTLRLLFISLLGIGVCLVFLTAGLALFHVGIFLYAPWTAEEKMYVTFICATLYVAGAFGTFMYIFNQRQWVIIFNAQPKIDALAAISRAQKQEKMNSRNGTLKKENV